MSDIDTIEIEDQLSEDASAPLSNFVYHEIRAELARRGIPPEQVAFIQEYQTKAGRAALFAAINAGRIRVLIASKQSTGMNIQQRLIALHHLDCPWRPGDLEQREGRILRQGNHFPEAMVFAYVTEGSFDSYAWQTVETKAGFIEQMKRGDVTVREVEDIGDAVLSAAEIKAIASGNPLVMEKVKLEMTLQTLEAEQAADRNNRIRMRQTLAFNETERQRAHRRVLFLTAAKAQAEATATQDFKVGVVNGVLHDNITSHTKRQEAGAAVLKMLQELDALATIKRERQNRIIGRYRGFELSATGYAMGGAELLLRFEHAGEVGIVSTSGISTKTDLGVFQSIDAVLRGIDREIAGIERRIADLDADNQKISTLLDMPWVRAIELREAHERLARINAQLDLGSAEGISPAPTIPDPSGDTEGFATCEADDLDSLQAELNTFLAMEQPLVLLPEPRNTQAMAAAIRNLSNARLAPEATETQTAEAAALTVEPLIIATTAAEAEQAAIGAANALSATLPPVIEPAPPTTVSAPRTRLIFGQRLSDQRTRRMTKPTTTPSASNHIPDQLDLFGDLVFLSDTPPHHAPAQASLF